MCHKTHKQKQGEMSDEVSEMVSLIKYDRKAINIFKKDHPDDSFDKTKGSMVVVFRNGKYIQLPRLGHIETVREILRIVKDDETYIIGIVDIGAKRL